MKNMKKTFLSRNAVTLYIVAIFYIVLSIALYSGRLSRQFTNMVVPISCYIVLAVSLNLVVGLLGELSLGHAGFMSVGLFSGCLVSIALEPYLPLAARMPLSMLVGGIFAAVIGLVVGLPALRLRGDYLAIVTLGCGEIIKNVITNLKITGGALGLNTGSIYSAPQELLPFAIVLVFITVALMMNLKNSRHGRAITAIRDNRIAAEATGINVTYYKLMVFVLAAFLAGMAGTIYGHHYPNIKATSFDYNVSIEILVIVVLGGMGSVRGAVISAILLRALPEVLRSLPTMFNKLPVWLQPVLDFFALIAEYRMLVYSVLLIVIMLLKGRFSFRSVIDFFKKKKYVVTTETEE